MTVAFPLQWPAGWPRTPVTSRERGSQFKQGNGLVTFAVAREKLYGELEKLGAGSVIVSTNHKPDRYGIPIESSRKPPDDGIAIYFQLAGRSMAMACDRFDNAAANMRSLGLAIEAMRQLERHGGGQMVERAFTGFAALPPPDAKKPWRETLGLKPGDTLADAEVAFRIKARIHHPDNGGTADDMAELNAAIRAARQELQT